MSILIGIATFILIIISVFLILVVLAQKAKSDGGVGAAMGGGMAEATFGAETGNVLSKATINASIAFFVLSFLLYLGHVYQHKNAVSDGGALPDMPASTLPAPATTSPAATTPSPSGPAQTEVAPDPATPAVQAPATTPDSAETEKK